MNQFKRLFSLIVVLCLALSVGGCGKEAEETKTSQPQYEKGTVCKKDSPLTFQDDSLILNLNPADCSVSVTEKSSGRVWESNPTSEEELSTATGVAKTMLQSQLAVNYVGSTNQIVKTNSYAASVKKGTYDIYKIKNGFRVEYKFDKGFTVPVSYTIENGKFIASILYTGITEDKNLISTIEFLPYFGTASTKNQGFILVPDGSGAVINLNNGKTDVAGFSKKVYGVDESLPNDMVTTREEQIYIPVIGMNKDGGAFVAEATDGSAESYVEASVSGKDSDFNSVYFKAIYRTAENLSVMNGSLGTAGLVMYTSKETTDAESFTVEYNFVKKENATLGDMASLLRNEFIKDGKIKSGEDTNKFFVDLYGGVSKQKSFAGIQYNGVETLTDFTDAQKLLDYVLDSGATNISVGYKNYSKSYFGNNIEVDLTPDSAIGGKKGLKKFIKYTADKKIDLYMHADYYSFRSSGNGFSKYFDITKDLDLGGTKIYPKKLNTNVPNSSAEPYYLLKPANFVKASEMVVKSADKLKVNGIYLGDISSKLSGDFEIGLQKRNGSVEKVQKSAETLSEKSLIMSSPNMYMWQYADSALDLPVYSSKNHIFDYDVPFLQMLLKGSIPYSGYEMNLYNTNDDTLLRHFAFGQNIHYGFMAADPSKLQNTELINLYGLSSSKIGEVCEKAKEFEKFYSHIKGLYIEDYVNYGNVSKTVYGNNTEVFVNYGDSETQIDSVTVAANGYTVVVNGKTVLSGGALK